MRGNQKTTLAIVLARTNYGEADRILTLLTPHEGKIRLMAKGVRRIKSKNSGGIELFSISSITYLQGKGDIGTLISSRLETHFGAIMLDIDRTMLGYECIRQVNKVTEDECEAAYFNVLSTTFTALNDSSVGTVLLQSWFTMQLLMLTGHAPNISTDTQSQTLVAGEVYAFSLDDMAFAPSSAGKFTSNHIKLLRLLQSTTPTALTRVAHVTTLADQLYPLLETMRKQSIGI